MKFLKVVSTAIFLPSVLAGGQSAGSGCCKFTLSSAGPFNCPAGQLSDGQIRLNGTEPTSTFCISPDGKITDQAGFGCIVTEPPTTQIQCDQGEEPKAGFSIGTDHLLQYQGSSSFFACPATDSEWNIYVSPDFGQLKCVPITLTADGCGSQVSSCSVAPPSTIYQTQWTTQWATQWVTQQNYSTITVTETTIDNKTTTETETKTDTTTQLCTSSSTTASGCKKCSHKTSLGWNTTTGWNDTTSTSLCPHCTGTGTGIWTTTSTSTDTTSVVSTAPTNSVLETLTTLI